MNNEAIGAATVAIRNLLQNGLGTDYAVSLYSPWEDFGTAEGVNLFLYKVEENPQWKNMDWPGNRSNPTKIPRPPLSLDLFYLLTPYAPRVTETSADEAQTYKILGKAMQILHENPVLNDIRNPYFDADNDEHFSEDLRDSFEKIKITLNPIDTEEMSRIWSMGEKPYRLSVTYHVSLVQIAPTVPPKPIAAPIQETALTVTTFEPPLITELNPSSGPVGTQLHIIGVNVSLKGFRTLVRFGEASLTDFISATEGEIVLTVPDDLKKGPEQKITVVIDGRESKPELFQVSPWVTSIKPQRGAIDSGDTHAVAIEIHGNNLQGAVQISIGGAAIDPGDITVVSENLINTYVPKTLRNGHHDIDITVNGNAANKRTFEVTPLIKNIDPSQGRPGDTVQIKGQRLKGTKIGVSIGRSYIILGANTNSTRISFNIPKPLSAGKYEVKVTVDNHESNSRILEVRE
ncbi:MAG: Pvc16 family protein [Candidatus Hodarchaeota archaeon]